MCHAFMCSGSENFNLTRKLTVESVCIICRMDVVERVYRRFDSSTILQLSTFFHANWLRWLYLRWPNTVLARAFADAN